MARESEGQASRSGPPKGAGLVALGWPALALGAGIAMIFGEMFLSGLSLHPADPTDPRFTEFLLEHSFRWITGQLDGSLFDLPMGYPLPGMLAHAEPMVSFGPVYWPFRLLGLSSSTSHQLWLVAMAMLNFGAFYALARRALCLAPAAASASGFVFAFGLPRVAQIGHSQLWPWCFFLLAVYGLYLLIAEASSQRDRRRGVVAVAAGLVLQLWGSIYVGVFLAYVCLVTVVFVLAHPAWRPRAMIAMREAGGVALVIGPLALLCLWPLLAVYSDVAATSQWDERSIPRLQPRLSSFVFVWESSWLYGWMARTPIGRLPAPYEQALGVGVVTSAIALVVLVQNRRQPVVQLCAVLATVLLVPVLVWPGGWTLWASLHEFMPGYGDLRAISRVGLLALIPISAAVGIALQRGRDTPHARVWIAIVVFALFEQGSGVPSYAKAGYEEVVRRIADEVDPEADAFFYMGAGNVPAWVSQIDALLAAQQVGVPAVNMYTGRYPQHWQPLADNTNLDRASRARIERHLIAWLESNGHDPGEVQRIDLRTILSRAANATTSP